MTPAYIRWRCERIEQLLRFTAASLRWKSSQAKHWKSLGKVTHGQRQSLCPWVGRTA